MAPHAIKGRAICELIRFAALRRISVKRPLTCRSTDLDTNAPNLRRRQLLALLGAITPVFSPFVLTSCGGGGDDGDTTTSEPVVARIDAAYLFDPDDPRLLHVATADGFTLSYYGDKDASGNVSDVTDFYYTSTNQATPDFHVQISPTALMVAFKNGERFDFFQIGQQYQVRWQTVSPIRGYLSIFDPSDGSQVFEDVVTSITAASTTTDVASHMLINASGKQAVGGCLLASSEKMASTPVPASSAEAEGTQRIVVTVSDQCGVVSNGVVTVEVKLGTFYNTDTKGTRIIDPPLHKTLEFSVPDQAFVGEVPLSQLHTVKQALETETAILLGRQLTGQIQKRAILPLAAQALAPGASKAELKEITEKTDGALSLFENLKKLLSPDPVVVAEVLGDATHAVEAGGLNKLFPITVDATYTGISGSGFNSTMVDVPGSNPANITVSVGDASMPCANENLAGDWFGTVKDDQGIGFQYYELNLTVIGTTVVGTSRVGTPSGQFFAAKKLTGGISGNTFKFVETTTISQLVPPGHFWCTVNATLILSVANGIPTLAGPWTATQAGCLNGNITLTKKE
jgi:hypothetical protein